MIYLPISVGVAALALGQSYDCPSASEVTLNDMSKITCTEPQQNKAKQTVYICRCQHCTYDISIALNVNHICHSNISFVPYELHYDTIHYLIAVSYDGGRSSHPWTLE